MSITEKKILTFEEQQQLDNLLHKHSDNVTGMNIRDVLLISLTRYTGARSAEILLLTPSDIGASGNITITAVKQSDNRTIPISKELHSQLVKYIKDKNIGDKERIFPITTRHFRRIWDTWRPNKNKGLHSLRHTLGTQLYMNCENIFTVKHVLGHKELSNTMKYMHYIEGQKDLRDKMKNMFKKKIG